jgi:hypothetical protein
MVALDAAMDQTGTLSIRTKSIDMKIAELPDKTNEERPPAIPGERWMRGVCARRRESFVLSTRRRQPTRDERGGSDIVEFAPRATVVGPKS